jgi:hypothetical protein
MLLNLMTLFRKTEPKIDYQTKVQVIERTPFDLRLSEWRADRTLCASARNLFGERDFYTILQVIANEHPANLVHADAIPIEQRAIIQARAEGYTLALSNLASMAHYSPMSQPLEATFEPEHEVTIPITEQ